MPYQKFTRIKGGKTQYCVRHKITGKVYCSASKEARDKMIRLHEAYKHMGGK